MHPGDPVFNPADPAHAAAIDEASVWSARFGAMLLDRIALAPGVRGLDVGCGCGFPLLELAEMHGVSSTWVGVDVWDAGLRRAACKRDVHGLDVGLVRGDGAGLPFADGVFDVIVSNVGVNNFANAPAALVECARVARPGARLALTTNVQGHMTEFYRAFEAELAASAPDRLDALRAEEGHRATEPGLCAMLEAAGWRVDHTVDDRFTLRYADGDAFLRHHLTRIGFLDGWRRVTDDDAVFDRVRRRLDALAAEHGELRLTVPMLYVEATRSA